MSEMNLERWKDLEQVNDAQQQPQPPTTKSSLVGAAPAPSASAVSDAAEASNSNGTDMSNNSNDPAHQLAVNIQQFDASLSANGANSTSGAVVTPPLSSRKSVRFSEQESQVVAPTASQHHSSEEDLDRHENAKQADAEGSNENGDDAEQGSFHSDDNELEAAIAENEEGDADADNDSDNDSDDDGKQRGRNNGMPSRSTNEHVVDGLPDRSFQSEELDLSAIGASCSAGDIQLSENVEVIDASQHEVWRRANSGRIDANQERHIDPSAASAIAAGGHRLALDGITGHHTSTSNIPANGAQHASSSTTTATNPTTTNINGLLMLRRHRTQDSGERIELPVAAETLSNILQVSATGTGDEEGAIIGASPAHSSRGQGQTQQQQQQQQQQNNEQPRSARTRSVDRAASELDLRRATRRQQPCVLEGEERPFIEDMSTQTSARLGRPSYSTTPESNSHEVYERVWFGSSNNSNQSNARPRNANVSESVSQQQQRQQQHQQEHHQQHQQQGEVSFSFVRQCSNCGHFVDLSQVPAQQPGLAQQQHRRNEQFLLDSNDEEPNDGAGAVVENFGAPPQAARISPPSQKSEALMRVQALLRQEREAFLIRQEAQRQRQMQLHLGRQPQRFALRQSLSPVRGPQATEQQAQHLQQQQKAKQRQQELLQQRKKPQLTSTALAFLQMPTQLAANRRAIVLNEVAQRSSATAGVLHRQSSFGHATVTGPPSASASQNVSLSPANNGNTNHSNNNNHASPGSAARSTHTATPPRMPALVSSRPNSVSPATRVPTRGNGNSGSRQPAARSNSANPTPGSYVGLFAAARGSSRSAVLPQSSVSPQSKPRQASAPFPSPGSSPAPAVRTPLRLSPSALRESGNSTSPSLTQQARQLIRTSNSATADIVLITAASQSGFRSTAPRAEQVCGQCDVPFAIGARFCTGCGKKREWLRSN